MKYLEELDHGSCFVFEDQKFILTKDFRSRSKNTEFCCINITTGFVQWIEGNQIVKIINLYYIDDEKNLVAIKEYTDEFSKNQNIS